MCFTVIRLIPTLNHKSAHFPFTFSEYLQYLVEWYELVYDELV